MTLFSPAAAGSGLPPPLRASQPPATAVATTAATVSTIAMRMRPISSLPFEIWGEECFFTRILLTGSGYGRRVGRDNGQESVDAPDHGRYLIRPKSESLVRWRPTKTTAPRC